MAQTLLVIDDHEASCRLVQAIFSAEDFRVFAAHDGAAGRAAALQHRPDLVLLDLRLPGVKDLELLEELRALEPTRPVIMLTADRDLKTVVRATQLGAFDYLTKPIDQDEVLVVVRRALQTRDLQREVESLRKQVGESDQLAVQMGSSAQAKHVIEQVRLVAASDFSVLVLGETGTGKELVAQAIHRNSPRRDQPYVALDCGAIPEPLMESELFGHERGAFTGAERKKTGHFQLAQGGTFFLDEIGNLTPGLQAKLLRVLESKQVHALGSEKATRLDVRFVAATNDELQARVANKQFRADLYFRLAQYTITLPALRERTDDIPYLAQRFLEEASVELRKPVQRIMPDALAQLVRHRWPGNVRELRNVMRQAVLLSTDLVIRRDVVRSLLGKQASLLPSVAGASQRSLKEVAEDAARAAERTAITETLRATFGNKSEGARILRTDYKTLHLKMKALGIRARDFLRDDVD